jgi:hypothetical protein
MEMFQNWFSGSGSSQRLYTYTDNNGRFKFEYKNQTDSHISLWYGTNSNNTTKILMGLPAKQNIELGNVYVENKTYLYVKINCNSPHSISDTLYYAIFGTKTSIGPFQTILYDSVLASKGVFAGENSYNIPNETGNLVWGLGYEDFMRANNSLRPNILDYHIECFTYRGCGYKDTAFINVP